MRIFTRDLNVFQTALRGMYKHHDIGTQSENF